MMRAYITTPLLLGLLVCFGPGCASRQPHAEKKLLPYMPEPEFEVLGYMPKDKVLESTYPRTIGEILAGRDYIIRHFRDVIPLKRCWFSYEKSLGVKIGDHTYRRDIYVYTYNNIETMHGPPDQEIILWYDFVDSRNSTNVWKVFTRLRQEAPFSERGGMVFRRSFAEWRNGGAGYGGVPHRSPVLWAGSFIREARWPL